VVTSRRARLDGHLLGLLGTAAGFGALPIFFGSNVVVIDVTIMVFVYATVASAWNLVGGYVGQFALANAVFYGAGAYTSTVLLTRYGLSPWVGMILGGFAAVAIAIVIGYPCLRLGFHYFAVGTFVVGEAVRLLFVSWNFVGAAEGIFIPMGPSDLGTFQFRSHVPYYYIGLALMLLALGTTYTITRTRLVFYLRAIRGDPEAALSVGIDVPTLRLRVFCLMAFLTALPGTFMAQYLLYIDPQSFFDVQISILASLIPILGGIGTLWGPLLGALVLIPLGEITRAAFGGTGRAADLLIFGGLIVLLALFRPTGLLGIFQDGARLATRRKGGLVQLRVHGDGTGQLPGS
jgi:branched-chain amino acid transport system permease protein